MPKDRHIRRARGTATPRQRIAERLQTMTDAQRRQAAQLGVNVEERLEEARTAKRIPASERMRGDRCDNCNTAEICEDMGACILPAGPGFRAGYEAGRSNGYGLGYSNGQADGQKEAYIRELEQWPRKLDAWLSSRIQTLEWQLDKLIVEKEILAKIRKAEREHFEQQAAAKSKIDDSGA